jgi:uncharacterized membrane protein
MISGAFLGKEVAVLVLGIPAVTFWPYFAGGITLIIGLACFPKQEIRSARGPDKLIWFGPLLVAIAIAIFGADHFATAKFVAMIVPRWMPWRLFWAYFVGVALLAGALSLASKVYWRLAAALFGIMLWLFVAMLHIPNLFLFRQNSALVPNLLLRDMAIGSGPFAFGISGLARGRSGGSTRSGAFSYWAILIARFTLAVPIAIFGAQHFLQPGLAPGIPSATPTLFISLPGWIPALKALSYLTGALFLSWAIGLTVNRYARLAAKALGVTMLALLVIVYIPLTIAKASDVASGLNFVGITCALAGSALMLAEALTPRFKEAADVGAEATSVRQSTMVS